MNTPCTDATAAEVRQLRTDVEGLRQEFGALRAELGALTKPAEDAPKPDAKFVSLRDVAGQLQITTVRLRRMALAGKFPQALVVARGHWLVLRKDLEAWKQGRWTTDIATRTQLVKSIVQGEKVHNRRRTAQQQRAAAQESDSR